MLEIVFSAVGGIVEDACNIGSHRDSGIMSASIHVSEDVIRCAEEAIARIGYLYPALQIVVNGQDVIISGTDLTDEVLRDVRYIFYRAKVACEGTELRGRLYRAVLG